MDIENVQGRNGSKWRLVLVIVMPVLILGALAAMLMWGSVTADHGRADLSGIDFSNNKLVRLDGQWEFYWNKVLMPEDFDAQHKPQVDAYMKVPGVWAEDASKRFPRQGLATYRLILDYPSALNDPALRVQNVANAYKLYVNGKLMAEVGRAWGSEGGFKNDEKILIIDLPKDTSKVELVFQVGNLDCATGGLRAAPVFGSKQVLERQRVLLLVLQVFFIGSVFIFGIHYFILALLVKESMPTLLFGIFCLVTALRSLVWGETPLNILFPDVSLDVIIHINYFTGYNYVAIVVLFIYCVFPMEFNKKVMGLVLFPSLVFDLLLIFTSVQFVSFYTSYLYIVLLIQMIYVMGMLIKSVLHKRDNAVLMFVAICILVWVFNPM